MVFIAPKNDFINLRLDPTISNRPEIQIQSSANNAVNFTQNPTLFAQMMNVIIKSAACLKMLVVQNATIG